MVDFVGVGCFVSSSVELHKEVIFFSIHVSRWFTCVGKSHLEFVSKGPIDSNGNIGLGIGSAPDMQQAIPEPMLT